METVKYEAGFADFLTSTAKKDVGSDQQIRFVVEFDGKINIDLMEKTMHAITNRDPVLGCRLVQKGFEHYWERQNNLDSKKMLTVIEADDVESAAIKFMSEEIDVFKVPLLRVCVVRGQSRDTLCLRVNHALADGGGTKEAIYLIADTYKKICEDPSIGFKIEEYIPRTLTGLLKKYTDVKIPDNVEMPGFPKRKFESPKNYFKLPIKNNGSTGPDFALRKIEPENFLKLKYYGKQRGATVNDMILTSLIRILSKISNMPDGAEVTLQVSNDIRSAFPKDMPFTICNVFGMNFPPFYYHTNEPFEDTLKMVNEKMNEAKKESKDIGKRLENELRMKKFIEEMAISKEERPRPPRNFNRPEDYTHIISSNFTLIDKNRLDFGNVKIKDAFELGTISYGGEFMLCASTYQSRMTLSTGYCHSNVRKRDIDDIMDLIVGELINR